MSGGKGLCAPPDAMDIVIDTSVPTSSPEMQFDVNFNSAGTYHVWVRYKATAVNPGTSDSLHPGLGGSLASGDSRLGGFNGTAYSWRNRSVTNTRLVLAVPGTGFHTVAFWMRENGLSVDKVLLTKDANYVPTSNGPAESGFSSGAAALLAGWPFDNSGVDASGNGHTATVFGGASYDPEAPTGTHALRLSGSASQYAAVAGFDLGSKFTVAGFVKLDTGRSNIQTILANAAGGSSNEFKFYVNTYDTTDGAMILETKNGSGGSNSGSSVGGVVTPGQWNHVAVSVDRAAGTAMFYLNGGNVTSDGEIRTDFATDNPLNVGRMPNGVYPLGGGIDDLQIFDRVLTPLEIANLAGGGYFDFSGLALSSYSVGQDGSGGFATTGQVVESGQGVNLSGNAWKKISLPYDVKATTVLEFEVQGRNAGEIIGISLDEDNDHTNSTRVFHLGGSQSSPSDMFSVSPKYVSPGAKTYIIPVGQFFTGTTNYLGFVCDDDLDGNGNVTFRDIRIYEQ